MYHMSLKKRLKGVSWERGMGWAAVPKCSKLELPVSGWRTSPSLWLMLSGRKIRPLELGRSEVGQVVRTDIHSS